MDRNRFRVSFLTAVMVLSALSGCGDRSVEREKEDIPGSAEQSNVQGTINGDVREDQEPDMDIREETNVPNETKESEEPDKIRSAYEVREGVSGFTLQYDDLPEAYQVTSSFSYEAMNRRPPLPEGDSTVLRAVPDPAQTQVFYLWEEGNAPARTSFTSDMTGYYDSYDFRPYVTALTIPEGVEAKGPWCCWPEALSSSGEIIRTRCPLRSSCGSTAIDALSWITACGLIPRRRERWT